MHEENGTSLHERLARLEAKTDAILEQVKRTNGSVEKLWIRTDELAGHPESCPVKARVAALELKNATEEGSARTSARWRAWVIPATLGLIAGLLIEIVKQAIGGR